MTSEIQLQNLKPETLGGPSPASSLRDSAWTPDSLQAKLLDRFEAAFGKHYHPADKCPSNRLYLAILLRTHFRLQAHVAQELATHTTTIRELLDQLTALLCPGSSLFVVPPLGGSDSGIDAHAGKARHCSCGRRIVAPGDDFPVDLCIHCNHTKCEACCDAAKQKSPARPQSGPEEDSPRQGVLAAAVGTGSH